MRHRTRAAAATALMLVSVHVALAEAPEPEAKSAATETPPAARFHEQTSPAPGTPSAIGEYSAGCVRGAVALPLEGAGYQVMHPSRLRYFGHPDLVTFLKRLGRSVRDAKLAPLLVGDLSQPRGGRAPGGHASHQTGLDVDLWYWTPKQASRRTLSADERETIKARSVLDGKAQAVAQAEGARVLRLLQLTAADTHVERIFVHPWIKRQLCNEMGASSNAPREPAGVAPVSSTAVTTPSLPPEPTTAPAAAERAWLGKIRPWYGHDDHFHVRLACPKGSAECVGQQAPPPGDGCDELDYWLSDARRAERDEGRKQYVEKVVTEPKLPAACLELLK